jgi:hypothetical protein
MNIDRDHLRRAGRASQREHEATLQPFRDALMRGLDRRRFLQIGGASMLSAALLAACGDDDNNNDAASAKPGKTRDADVAILRTASSLEHVAIDVYQKAIDNAGALGITAAVADVAKLFQAQHRDHAALFEGATKQAGGTPFTTANPAVMQSLAARIAALKTETDVVTLARDLENVAAATYQSTAGAFENLAYNAAAMSVGGVEARHAAVLNGVLKADQFATKAFHTTTGAVAVGTGL